MMKMAEKVDKYITNDMALDFQAGVPIRTIPSVESPGESDTCGQ